MGDYTEAKNGFKTSEMYVAVALIVAILIATYVDSDDTLGHQQGWLFASIVAAAPSATSEKAISSAMLG